MTDEELTDFMNAPVTDEELTNIMSVLEDHSRRGAFGFRSTGPDQKMTPDDLSGLGDRWIVIVDDVNPAEGPNCCYTTFTDLIGRSTIGCYRLGPVRI